MDADRWIDSRKWEQLADETEIPEGATIYVGADGSRSYDTTAIAWAYKAEDGRIDVACRVFSVRAEVPHHVLHVGTIDFGDVEAFLLELASRYQVAEVRFDPRFLERSMDVVAGRLSAQVAPVEPYSGAHRLALAAFERAVLDGTIRHTGDEAVTGQGGRNRRRPVRQRGSAPAPETGSHPADRRVCGARVGGAGRRGWRGRTVRLRDSRRARRLRSGGSVANSADPERVRRLPA